MSAKETLLSYKEKFHKEFNLIPVLGCELEFYSSSSTPVIGLDFVKEDGHNQFEIRLGPATDILKFIDEIHVAKAEIIKSLKPYKKEEIFAAKPFEYQPGSALQVHLNFITANGQPSLKVLDYAISGLLHSLPDLMIFFAPNEDSYKRYEPKSMTAPTTISWGPNNRTAALRLLKDFNKIHRGYQL